MLLSFNDEYIFKPIIDLPSVFLDSLPMIYNFYDIRMKSIIKAIF